MLTKSGAGLLVLAAVSYLFGVLLDAGLLISAAVLFLVLVGCAVVWVLPRPRVAIRRRLDPDRVTVGDSALGSIRLANEGARRIPPLVARDHLGGREVEVPLPRLRPGEWTREVYELPTGRRGLYTVGPLTIEQVDPFGLARRRQGIGDEQLLWVHPRRHPLRASLPTPKRSLEGETSDIAPRGTVTFHALREYVAGDDLRHVHWRSSARLGQLMVREYIDTSLPDVTVVLDTRSGVLDADEFDTAAEVAASVLTAYTAHSFPARLLTTCGTELSSVGGTQAGISFLDRLASIEQVDDGGFHHLRGVGRGRDQGLAVVFVVGSLAEDDATALQLLAHRFRSGVVVQCGRSAASEVRFPGLAVLPGSTSEQFAAGWNGGEIR